MGRLVVVSNRVALPSERAVRAGGLAIGLRDAMRTGGLWFGWSGTVSDDAGDTAHVAQRQKLVYATIDLKPEEYQRYYLEFANSTLWPLFHYRLGLVEFDRRALEIYWEANERFARALLPLLKADDLIWVHDYHLIPLASALRKLGVKNRIGFFLHVPFVPPAVYAVLPRGTALLESFLDYDLVGLQTAQDATHFADSMRALLKVPNVQTGVFRRANRAMTYGAFPIGIEAREFRGLAERAAQEDEAGRLLASLGGRTLIIGADRLDYSKGLPHKVTAFGSVLSRFPEHRNKVTYLQVAARSRDDVEQYRTLRRELERLVGRVNGQHAEFDWVPMRYLSRGVQRRTLAGFFRAARVGFVTPLRDGMNLVAKEYVAAQDEADPGVLLLSPFAGAAQELDGALIANPFDPDELAEALHQALTMPLEERRDRWSRMWEHIASQNAATWSANYLQALKGDKAGGGTPPGTGTQTGSARNQAGLRRILSGAAAWRRGPVNPPATG
jgi:trehalose 6-phosphate synthase